MAGCIVQPIGVRDNGKRSGKKTKKESTKYNPKSLERGGGNQRRKSLGGVAKKGARALFVFSGRQHAKKGVPIAGGRCPLRVCKPKAYKQERGADTFATPQTSPRQDL
nr:hypothetical protein [Pandoravirus massiliensis]